MYNNLKYSLVLYSTKHTSSTAVAVTVVTLIKCYNDILLSLLMLPVILILSSFTIFHSSENVTIPTLLGNIANGPLFAT